MQNICSPFIPSIEQILICDILNCAQFGPDLGILWLQNQKYFTFQIFSFKK
jgi:hypothetical protein